MNLNRLNWKDENAKRVTIELSNHLERATQANLFPQFTAVFLTLADMYPADRENILAILQPRKASRATSTKRDASHMVAGALRSFGGAVPTPTNFTPDKDKDCEWCPDSLKKAKPSPALKELERIQSAHDDEPELPAELFENEPKTAPKKVLKRETADFTMGETVEEVLFAHGKGAEGVDMKEVKERLLATLAIVDDVEYDRRWGVEKLAGAILEHKGIDPI